MKAHNPAATDAIFEQLFRDYQRPILNYLCRLVGDDARAEEITQDVFVRAYRALPGLAADANRQAWLFRIATNAAYDHLRRRRLVQWLPLLDHDSPIADTEERAGQQEAVQRALNQLSPDYRAPLILYAIQGYSLREIGETLGISEGAAKTRLCRAREKFRQVYDGDI